MFVYKWQCVFFLAIFISSWIGDSFHWTLKDIRKAKVKHGEPMLEILGMRSMDFVNNCFKWFIWTVQFIIAQYYFAEERKIKEKLKDFDVRSASCGNEEDIPLLLDSIREHFRDGQSNGATEHENRKRSFGKFQHFGSYFSTAANSTQQLACFPVEYGICCVCVRLA